MSLRPLRFLIAGGSAATIEFLVFAVLQHLQGKDWLFISQSLSFCAGLIVSFAFNRLWVFRSDDRWSRQFLKYGIVAAINLLLGNVAIALLVGPAHLDPFVAKVPVMAVIAAWNYVLFSKIIFRRSSQA